MEVHTIALTNEELQQVKADKHARGKYNLAKVNAVHNALSSYMDRTKGKVFNTKYMVSWLSS